MEIKVIAVIVSYNDFSSLKKCIDSIAFQTYPIYKILIIDNSESKDFQVRVNDTAKTYGKLIDIFPTEKNSGSAGGFSIGMDIAYKMGAEWIWLHDEDDYPETECLEKMLASNDYLIRTPVVKDPTAGNTLYYFKKRKKLLGYYSNSQTDDCIVDVSGTAGILIHHSVIEKTGIYNPDFFIGYEDYDYCLRAAENGFKIGVMKDATLWHPDKQSLIIKKSGKLEKLLGFMPAFFGALRRGNTRDYYAVRNFIYLSIKHNSFIVFFMQVLISIPLLILYSFFNRNIDLKMSLKTYADSIRQYPNSFNSKTWSWKNLLR